MTRHGATPFNDEDLIQGWADNLLSGQGKAQAERLAQRMKDKKLDMIYHTTLTRTKETAEIINQYHNTPMKVIESFIEMNLGDWEGENFHKVVREHPEIYQEWATNPDAEVPGGETFRELYERIEPGVEEVMNCPYEHILIVAHAMVNRAVMGKLMGMDALMARSFRVDNCSYSRLLLLTFPTGPHMLVDTWNDIQHL
jgi:probable phosphoglycerate mutase